LKTFIALVLLAWAVRSLWRREDSNGQPHAESGMLAVWLGLFGLIVLVFALA
jgi:hypothetical protein